MIPAWLLPLVVELGKEAYDLIAKAIAAKTEERTAILARFQNALLALRDAKSEVHAALEARDAATKAAIAAAIAELKAHITTLVPATVPA